VLVEDVTVIHVALDGIMEGWVVDGIIFSANGLASLGIVGNQIMDLILKKKEILRKRTVVSIGDSILVINSLIVAAATGVCTKI
tara:strand:+ start:429 stop:680 length:252 start_codon:yes stop_codon:yes gene_type:complete